MDEDLDDYVVEYGEEGHEEVEIEEDTVESVLTIYDPEDFKSGAILSERCTIPPLLFDFVHSYGYNCKKVYNLCACDENVVAWASGNIVTFFNVQTKKTWFRRSSTGGGVGSIASYCKGENYRIAIAEGEQSPQAPIILLYTWPEMQIDAVLREGTSNSYSIMDFSPDGEWLASVGNEPDYNLTIWDWKHHNILLRTSAFTFDIFNVVFSPYVPGQLTTAGAAHIKFWKMASTFTGLKLKGELGRFGKTEICDVLGIYPMPDEKVLSGCDWGNILVWEAGLVKVEITQRFRKPCHDKPIIQFLRSEDGSEVTTISMDGRIRTWYWDTVDQADPPEDDQFVELNPVAETQVPGAELMCIRQRKDLNWFGQDANGGVWCVDMELDKTECDHSKVFVAHSGSIVGLVALVDIPLLLTFGEAGAVHVYNTQSNHLVYRHKFPTPGTCTLYLPKEVYPTNDGLILGFEDGVIRVIHLKTMELMNIKMSGPNAELIEDESMIQLLMLLKPHSKAVTAMTINTQNTLLVTAGKDSTLFLYKIQDSSTSSSIPFSLERIGFIDTPKIVTCMCWKPAEERYLLLGLEKGLLLEVALPASKPAVYTEITTFKLSFDSVSETLVRDYYIRHRPLPEEDELVSLDEDEMKALKARQMNKDKDDLELEWIGEVEIAFNDALGDDILWVQYDPCTLYNYVWVVLKGTGALLRMKPGFNDVYMFAPIPNGWRELLTTVMFVCDNRYILVGTGNGYIRFLRMPTVEEDNSTIYQMRNMLAMKALLIKLNGKKLAKVEEDPVPRLEFTDHLCLPMHDRHTGAINSFAFSSDRLKMYSAGADSNIFSYNIHFPEPLLSVIGAEPKPKTVVYGIDDTADIDLMSHEELKQKEEYDKMMAIANEHKRVVRADLDILTADYMKMLRDNKMLPHSQQIDIILDPRPLLELEQNLQSLKELEYRKLSYQVEESNIAMGKMHKRNVICIDVFPFEVKSISNPEITLKTLRQKNLSPDFYKQLEEVHQKMAEAASRARKSGDVTRKQAVKKLVWAPPKMASFLLGLPPNPPHYLNKALRNYKQRLNRHHNQYVEWQEHLSRKPDARALPPGAEAALREAESTIGNHCLKTQEDYVTSGAHNTQLKLCLCREEIYKVKHDFNEKVIKLRKDKLALVEYLRETNRIIAEIKLEIPNVFIKPPPVLPEIDDDLEFPEKNLEVVIEPIAHKMKPPVESSRRKSSLKVQPRRIRCPRAPTFVDLYDQKTWLRKLIQDHLLGEGFVNEVTVRSSERIMDATTITIIKRNDHKRNEDNDNEFRCQGRRKLFRDLCDRNAQVKNPTQATWALFKLRSDEAQTAFLMELKERRIKRRIFEQEMLLAETSKAIKNWDGQLLELRRERVRVQEKSQLLELHLLQLHQEMLVLNRFEAHEDRLTSRVYHKLMQLQSVQELVESFKQQIEEHETAAMGLETGAQTLQLQFKQLVQDNRFADFLRRIFKKKYRPPRVRDPDESSESESSSTSSSEEDEAASLDSRDIGPIRLDPNICPEGCDNQTFEQTYQLRNKRHAIEQEIKEKERLVDCLKKDIEAQNKVARKLAGQLSDRQKDLKDFMCEKQSCLNEIESTVILRYDQIRASAIVDHETPVGLSKTLVFPEALLAQLRRRVHELRQEIVDQKARHKINKTHLQRMNVDCKYMEKVIEDLQAKIRLVLTRKMGRARKADQVLDDLLKQMTRRFKFQFTNKIGNQLRQQLMHWKNRYAELEQKYLATLENYSEKLRLAAALQADHHPSKQQRDLSKFFGSYHPTEYKRDVVRLRIIRTQQVDQIKNLRNEIKHMKMKPISPLPPFCESTQEASKEPVDEFQIFEFPPREDKKPLRFYPRRKETKPGEESTEIIRLLYAVMKDMAIDPNQGTVLMQQITALVPEVMSGKISRHEVIDKIMFKLLPTPERKKHTVSFDLLNQLLTFLIEEQMQDTELGDVTTDAEESLEATIMVAGAGIDPEAGLQAAIVKLLSGLLPMAPASELSRSDTIIILVAVLIEKIPRITEHNSDVDLEAIDLNVITTKLEDKVENMEDITNLIRSIKDGLKAQRLSEEEQLSLTADVEQEFAKGCVSSREHFPSYAEEASSHRTEQVEIVDSDEADGETDSYEDM